MSWFRRPIIRLFVTLVSIAMIVTLSRAIVDGLKRGEIVQKREEARVKLEQENEELRRRLAEAQSPQFVEREARNKLGMGREGETVIIMPNDQFLISNEEQKQDQLPNWKQWVGLFY